MRTLRIACGDWIYPTRDSRSGVQYPIDSPLVAEIFVPEADAGKVVAACSRISAHLKGPRYLEVLVTEGEKALQIISLKNSQEELFNQGIGFEIEFDLATLPRVRSIPDGKNEDAAAIFFASVLLQAHLAGKTLPKQIVFRDAKVPEVESLGKW